jgi:hypothetical protein
MSLATLMEKYGNPILVSNAAGMLRAVFYNAETNDTRIYVRDSSGFIFVLNPPTFLMADAFKTPHFYYDAGMRGIDNPRRLNPTTLAA